MDWGYWIYFSGAIVATATLIYSSIRISNKPKYKENPNLSILSDEAAPGYLIEAAIVALVCLAALSAIEIGLRGWTLLGWMIGGGLSAVISGSFLWVISLIWVKPEDRKLRWKQFVYWTAVIFLMGNWFMFFKP